MRAIDRMRIVAWACMLAGISLVVWQAASGNSSDMLFNIGVMAMVTGSVLRVYGKYRCGNRRVDVPREPPENRASL
jgi:drug/metabolite transporter (DMT)-like permease